MLFKTVFSNFSGLAAWNGGRREEGMVLWEGKRMYMAQTLIADVSGAVSIHDAHSDTHVSGAVHVHAHACTGQPLTQPSG